MSEVKRWAHTVTWEGLQISAAYMAIDHGGEYVMHADYVALAAERDALRQQRDKLTGLLRDVESAYTTAIHWEDMQTAMAQIKTALSELTP